MEFTVDRKSFHAALTVAAGVANRKSTMPILANALLRCDGRGKLVVAASDLSITIVSELSCDAKVEGAIALPAARLAEIAGAVKGESISIAVKDRIAEIKAGKAKFNIPGLSPADFPKLPSAPPTLVEFDAPTMLDLIEKTSYAASVDKNRANLNGINLKGRKDILRMEASDGHRLVIVERPSSAKLADPILFGTGVFADLARLMKGAAKVELAADAGHIYVRVGATLAAINKPEAVFPSVDHLIPEKSAHAVAAPRVALLDLFKRVSIVASKTDLTDRLYLFFGAAELTVKAESKEAGAGEETIELASSKEQTVCISAKYVIAALATMDGDEVFIDIANDRNQLVLRSTDGAHTCVVMTQG